ncbi:hypothetical protein Pmani_032084 [Petrolisthes manimaculis]|uniref:C2H2-type domain-containing protein n=1 Tax=Petrolisthes manimaculis TaxID=1843537 RepID=A0AAE1NTR7_9EUCA|nr:hypothetical protein Pmani_032084 [Petrolisthes manimaculis]
MLIKAKDSTVSDVPSVFCSKENEGGGSGGCNRQITNDEGKRIQLIRCEEGKENSGDTSAKHADSGDGLRRRLINILPRPDGLKENSGDRVTLLTLAKHLGGDDRLLNIVLRTEEGKDNSGTSSKIMRPDNNHKDTPIDTLVRGAGGDSQLSDKPTKHPRQDDSSNSRVTDKSPPNNYLEQESFPRDAPIPDTLARPEGVSEKVPVKRLIMKDWSARLREKNTTDTHTRDTETRPTGQDNTSHRRDCVTKTASETSNSSRKTQERARKSSPSTCYVCQKVYKNKWSLATHLRAKHKVAAPVCARMPCLEAGCNFRAGRIARLITHLIQSHMMKFQCEKVTFREKEDFWKWKRETEEHCQSTYSASTSAKKTVAGDTKYFLRCSRSGYAKSRVTESEEECWEREEKSGNGWEKDESEERGGGEELMIKREVNMDGDMDDEIRNDKWRERNVGTRLGRRWSDGKESSQIWTVRDGKGQRRSSSGKINAVCTSFMVATFAREGGASVQFCRTHYGHTLDSYQPKMTQTEQLAIKNMIAAGNSAHEIVASLKVSLPTNRHHVVKYSNIHNIATRHNLHLMPGRSTDSTRRLGMLAATQASLAQPEDLLKVEEEVEIVEEEEVEVEGVMEGTMEDWTVDTELDTATSDSPMTHLEHSPDKYLEMEIICNPPSLTEPTITSLQEQVMSKVSQVSTLTAGMTSKSALMQLNEKLDNLLADLESNVCVSLVPSESEKSVSDLGIELVPVEAECSSTDIVLDRDVVGNDIMLYCSNRPMHDFQVHSSKKDGFRT